MIVYLLHSTEKYFLLFFSNTTSKIIYVSIASLIGVNTLKYNISYDSKHIFCVETLFKKKVLSYSPLIQNKSLKQRKEYKTHQTQYIFYFYHFYDKKITPL